MTQVLQIREAAGQLPASDRADLAVYLLDSLDEQAHHWVEDQEVEQRRAELNSSVVCGLNLEEFRTACGR